MTADEPTPTENAHEPAKPPFQFGLKHVLAAPVWLALLFAAAIQFGFLGAILFILSTIVGIAIWFRARWWVWLLIGLAAAYVLLLPISTCHEAARRSRCYNNLQQISVALHNYHNVYGCFPPAYVTGENGRPMHSWRVLILPYLGEKSLYARYDFTEPWDGPDNHTLAGVQLPVFNCLGERDKPSTMTCYVAVVGPETAWPGGTSTKLSDFSDGPRDTILVVEVANSGIHWMEPRDLHVIQMAPGINRAGQGISSSHPFGAQVAFADGSVHFVAEYVSPETLRAMVTIDGGETIEVY